MTYVVRVTLLLYAKSMNSKNQSFLILLVAAVLCLRCNSRENSYQQLTCGDIYQIEDTVERFDLHRFGYQQLKGIQIPNSKLITLDGTTKEIHSLNKDAYLLDFWFIGCAPCEAEMPFLTELEHSFENVGFISIARNDPAELREYFSDRTDFSNLYLADSIYSELCVSGYPTKFILDSDFVIQNMFVGGSIDEEQVRSHVDELKNELELVLASK